MEEPVTTSGPPASTRPPLTDSSEIDPESPDAPAADGSSTDVEAPPAEAPSALSTICQAWKVIELNSNGHVPCRSFCDAANASLAIFDFACLSGTGLAKADMSANIHNIVRQLRSELEPSFALQEMCDLEISKRFGGDASKAAGAAGSLCSSALWLKR